MAQSFLSVALLLLNATSRDGLSAEDRFLILRVVTFPVTLTLLALKGS